MRVLKYKGFGWGGGYGGVQIGGDLRVVDRWEGGFLSGEGPHLQCWSGVSGGGFKWKEQLLYGGETAKLNCQTKSPIN